jgi:hypothetical protein
VALEVDFQFSAKDDAEMTSLAPAWLNKLTRELHEAELLAVATKGFESRAR